MLLPCVCSSHLPAVGIIGRRSQDLPARTAEPVHEDAATSRQIGKGRFGRRRFCSFGGRAAVGAWGGEEATKKLAERQMEWVEPGSPRWESSARAGRNMSAGTTIVANDFRRIASGAGLLFMASEISGIAHLLL